MRGRFIGLWFFPARPRQRRKKRPVIAGIFLCLGKISRLVPDLILFDVVAAGPIGGRALAVQIVYDVFVALHLGLLESEPNSWAFLIWFGFVFLRPVRY